MNTKKRGLTFIKKMAMSSAKTATKSACIGFCYQPVSPRRKLIDKKHG